MLVFQKLCADPLFPPKGEIFPPLWGGRVGSFKAVPIHLTLLNLLFNISDCNAMQSTWYVSTGILTGVFPFKRMSQKHYFLNHLAREAGVQRLLGRLYQDDSIAFVTPPLFALR